MNGLSSVDIMGLFDDPLEEELGDPVDWVDKQLAENDDCSFRRVGDGSWKSLDIKNGYMLETTVSVVHLDDDAFVSVETTVNIVPDDAEVVEFRIFQMVENGKFIRRGYKMAEAGKKVSFGSCREIGDGFDLNGLIGAGLASVGDQADCFRAIKNGADVEEVYWSHTRDHVSSALSALAPLSFLADD